MSACLTTQGRGALVINEVLYDPTGADRGAEWVEIHNTGPWPATLEGVALESGDGAGPGRWTRTWQGVSGEWIDAKGFCLVGGPWHGQAACSPGTLDLQNGPDGVRLVREGLVLDRVGWGDLTEPEYAEGPPAGTVAGGRSLARLEDGRDTDDNHADFSEATPTPGRWNHPARDLAVTLLRAGPPIPLSPGGDGLGAVIRLENRGTVALARDEIRLVVGDRTAAADPARVPEWLTPGLAVDLDVSLDVSGDPGSRTWTCATRCPGDLEPDNDTDTLCGWVGGSPLRISEVAPRPRPGGTEWIELESAFGAVDAEGWSLRDGRGTRLDLRGRRRLSPGARVVVARDSLAAVAEGFEPAPWVGSWPTLNDLATGGAGADTLWLADPTGLITDWAVWGTTRPEETWVRVPGAPVDAGLDAWMPADGQGGGTPGRPNSPEASSRVLAEGQGRGSLTAISLSRDPGGAWLPCPPAASDERRVLRLIRLDGSIAGEFSVAAGADRSWARWDGRSPGGHACPAGVYLLETRIVGSDGAERTTLSPIVVGR